MTDNLVNRVTELNDKFLDLIQEFDSGEIEVLAFSLNLVVCSALTNKYPKEFVKSFIEMLLTHPAITAINSTDSVDKE